MFVPNLHLAAARHRLKLATREQLIKAADEALNLGLYTHSLGELVTWSPSSLFDPYQCFDASLRELGFSLPSEDEAETIIMCDILRTIMEGTATPERALHRLYFDVRYGLNWPSVSINTRERDLGFLGMYYSYDDIRERREDYRTNEAEALRELDQVVIDAAARWHSEHGMVTVEPSWRTSNVLGLARAIRDEGAFNVLPVLADALDEAGCTNQEILAHCRSNSPHVRACWVVDLLMRNEDG